MAVHAIRNLARIGMGVVTVRWSQLGFGRTSSTSLTQDTDEPDFTVKGPDGEPLIATTAHVRLAHPTTNNGVRLVRRGLSRQDELNEYIRHVSSGLFACPPGVSGPDDYWGRALFA